MKICSIDEECRYGGPQQRTFQIAKELIKDGIYTHIVYPKQDSKRFKDEISKYKIEKTSINITRLSLEKKILFKYIFTFIKEVIYLYLFIKKSNFDIIQINGTPQYKGAIASKLVGVPVIWIFEDTQMPFLIRITSRVLAKICADGVVVTGESVYNYYIYE